MCRGGGADSIGGGTGGGGADSIGGRTGGGGADSIGGGTGGGVADSVGSGTGEGIDEVPEDARRHPVQTNCIVMSVWVWVETTGIAWIGCQSLYRKK